MPHFFSLEKFPVGLDLSDTSLKLIQFAPKGRGRAIRGFSDMHLPPGIVAADKIADSKALASLIREAATHPKFGRITSRFAVVSIPETKSFVRVIQMPKMTEDEAAEAVPWEAETYIPLPVGQVYLDWVILDEAPPDKMTVLIAASPRDYVDEFLNVLKLAELKPMALEVESQATARSLVSRNTETVMIMDIDTVRTSLVIYDKGILQFTSSLPIAGSSFTESISKALSVDMAAAEKLKRQFGVDEDAEKGLIKKALLPVLNNLVEEIKNTMKFYEEHSGEGVKIARLLLSGGGAKLKHLPSFLHDRLTHSPEIDHQFRSLPGIKVELGNPWVTVLGRGQTPPLSREASLSFATAIGLALREEEA